MIILYFILPLVGLFEMRVIDKEFIRLEDLRNKATRCQHHEKVYIRSLNENVTSKGLRIRKKPLIGRSSIEFKREWNRILVETERKIMELLKVEVKRLGIEALKVFEIEVPNIYVKVFKTNVIFL